METEEEKFDYYTCHRCDMYTIVDQGDEPPKECHLCHYDELSLDVNGG